MATKKTTGLQQVLKALMDKEIVGGKPMSANELSRRSHVPQSTITRILTGQSRDVRENVLTRIAGHFGITIGQLRGDESLGAQLNPFEVIQGHKPSGKKSGAEETGATPAMVLIYVDAAEAAMMTAYRESNAHGRAAIRATASAMSKAAQGQGKQAEN